MNEKRFIIIKMNCNYLMNHVNKEGRKKIAGLDLK